MHVVILIYAWLYAQGLWKSVIAVCVAFTVGRIVRFRPLKRIHAQNKRLEAQNVRAEAQGKRIEDLLNTETPGGLGDVVDALKHKNEGSSSPRQHPESDPQ
jgi:hypothetical protein